MIEYCEGYLVGRSDRQEFCTRGCCFCRGVVTFEKHDIDVRNSSIYLSNPIFRSGYEDGINNRRMQYYNF